MSRSKDSSILTTAIFTFFLLINSSHGTQKPPVENPNPSVACGELLAPGSTSSHVESQKKKDIVFRKTWTIGGELTVQFESDTPFSFTKDDQVSLAGHLPGIRECTGSSCKPDINVSHTKSDSKNLHLEQIDSEIKVSAPWESKIPADFVHLMYGAARRELLKKKIYPVHAACIGNKSDGYVLLIGAPGSGKTSLTLYNAVYRGLKIFSGDKTLIKLKSDGTMEAIAGTQTITVRANDVGRWSSVKKVNEHRFGDRLAFQLPEQFYESEPKVQIKKVFLVGLNDGVQELTELSPMSALHTLYPFFMDKQREDTLIGGDQALLDGTTSSETRSELSKSLLAALQGVPVYKVSASLDGVTTLINKELRSRPQESTSGNHGVVATSTEVTQQKDSKKVLYGVCGIGNGHCNRQLPVLKHILDQGHKVLVFTYGEGLKFFKDKFSQYPNLNVVEVANPYFIGDPNGLNFEQTALSDKNGVDFNRINALAMSKAAKEFGRPDLVISDYELVSAQYAYAKRAPLVTLDQQSKYLVGEFPQDLAGTSYIDEVERLSMFFPTAKKRMAVSFFNVPTGQRSPDHPVDILPPMIRPEIIAAKGSPISAKPSILVYITSQQLGNQPVEEWVKIIKSTLPGNFDAHVFLPARYELPANSANVSFYRHGNPKFDSLLIASHGVVTTAGHTLLSEAMYLEKPVYALPLPLYEQQLNAKIIADGGFGINEPTLSEGGLHTFLSNLDSYASNIRNDEKLLLKQPGNDLVIDAIDRILNK